jgi:hypothetical protein
MLQDAEQQELVDAGIAASPRKVPGVHWPLLKMAKRQDKAMV